MSKKSTTIYLQILIFFFVLYCFFVSIELMSGAFKLFGKGFAQQLMISTTNPVIGLMIGIFATSLVQSSSATSSIIFQCGRHFAVLSIKANTHCRGKTIWPVRRPSPHHGNRLFAGLFFWDSTVGHCANGRRYLIMLKNLLALLRKGDLVDQAIKETDQMFQKTSTLYREAVAALTEKRKSNFDLYRLDREINDYVKEIRRKLLENMSINPRQDIVASLVLISNIIDIERIGDYSKNIYELTQFCLADKAVVIDKALLKHAEFLNDQFDFIGKNLRSGNKCEAKNLMETIYPVKQALEQYICQTVRHNQGPVSAVVINVLFARYLKRVAGHLSNIASSIANPFDLIGFYDNKNPHKEVD